MKKIIPAIIILACTGQVTKAQPINNTVNEPTSISLIPSAVSQVPSSDIEKNNLMIKSRNQKIGAWVMMGVGAAGVITGIIIQTTNDVENIDIWGNSEDNSNNTGTFIAVAGGAFALGSIPLFIASSRNKTKAKLSVGFQKTGSGFVPQGISKNIPGLTMRFPIGK